MVNTEAVNSAMASNPLRSSIPCKRTGNECSELWKLATVNVLNAAQRKPQAALRSALPLFLPPLPLRRRYFLVMARACSYASCCYGSVNPFAVREKSGGLRKLVIQRSLFRGCDLGTCINFFLLNPAGHHWGSGRSSAETLSGKFGENLSEKVIR